MLLDQKQKEKLFGSVVEPSGGHLPDASMIKKTALKDGVAIVIFCSRCGQTYGIRWGLMNMMFEIRNMQQPESLAGKFFQVDGCTICTGGPPDNPVLKNIDDIK